MPELPEVETVRRQLIDTIVGRKIARVTVSAPKIVRNDKSFTRVLKGTTFTDIDRIGKLMIFATDQPDLYLLAHLKMTGQFIFQDGVNQAGGGHTLTKSDLNLPNKHTHVIFGFTDGSQLFYNDMRKFGYIERATADQVTAAKSRFGMEPIQPEYNLEDFHKIFTGRKTPVKALLLNQALIAGLGNIYVDEALFRAGVRPSRRADRLTESEREKLYHASRDVLQESIKAGGTTFYNFAHTNGDKGGYMAQLRVFARQGEPCLVCGTEIKKTKVAQRGTHYCPTCQT